MRKRQARQCQHLLLALASAIGALLLPGRAMADAYVERTYNYMVTLNGANTIRIKVPVYDEDGADHWVSNGNLKLQVADDKGNFGAEQTAFWWREDESSDGHDNDHSDLWCKFSTSVGGSFDVTQGNSASHFTLTKGDGTLRRLVYENNDRTYDVTVVWRLPYDFLGKTLKFSWDVKLDYTNGLAWDTQYDVKGLSATTIAMPKAADVVYPQTTMATISYSEQGKLEIPWFIGSDKVTAARYEYTDANGNIVSENRPANENNGTIYLNATEPHNNFHVIVSYRDNNDYLIENISSATQNLKMIHAPVCLTATPLGGHKAPVQLSWNIQYPGTDDMLETDFFEIQRSLTGEEADFVTIGTEPFVLDAKKLSFTYIDSLFVNDVAEGQLKGGGTLDHLTYRVRRMCTQTWGWEGNSTVATASCVVDDIHLLRITDFKALWDDERAYTVRVSWEYGDEHNAVWDNRALMKLRVAMVNRDGLPVDTLTYTLTDDEREQRYKIVSLKRPCVNYKIKLYIERGSSPLHLYEELGLYYFPIRNEDDWDTFCQKVSNAKGEYDVNARLYDDISSGNSCGDAESPFRGHFDGNGHTFTASISGAGTQAMFRYAKDYTITSLHVAGTVAGGLHTAGLVGYSDGSSGQHNTIANCRVSATVSCSDDHVGGIVGHGQTADHVITNCLFDGSITGSNISYAGAFMGWAEDGTTNMVASCLEKGTYTNVQHAGANYKYIGNLNASVFGGVNNWTYGNWGELNQVGEKTAEELIAALGADEWQTDKNGLVVPHMVKNLDPIRYDWIADYYEQATGASAVKKVTVGSISDWDRLADAVANGETSLDVTLTNDIELRDAKQLGTLTKPFTGFFNGGGHTITTHSITPFFHAQNAVIANLTVTGEMQSGDSPAGIVRYGRNIAIAACLVSVDFYHCHTVSCSFVSSASDVVIYRCVDACRLNLSGRYAYGGFIGTRVSSSDEIPNHNTKSIVADCISAPSPTSYFGNYLDRGSNFFWGDDVTLKRCYYIGSGMNFTGEFQGIKLCNADNTERIAKFVELNDKWLAKQDEWPLMTPMASSDYLPSNFHHESIGKIDKTLKTEPRQSSVLLTWHTDGNPIDFFTVLRRAKGSNDAWDTVESAIDQMSYEDTTVSPLEDYEYKVRATNDCEGQTYTETEVKEGACKHSGLAEGYVRFSDGTGVPGIEMEITSGSTKVTKTTDDSGYFMADELPYNGQQSITYTVTPVSTGGIQLEVESYAVTFNNHSNHEVVHQFTITNGLQFNAYVMYDGTSIPVKGAHFRVNGSLLHNAKGSHVETDFDGHAQFYVLNNTLNKIQVEMNQHTFTGGGWYKSADGVVLTDKVGQAYFYDSTLVKLTGRVVGGKDQGILPLDNNLSHNNLGDDLTMVLSLEGDNTSWLVYDNLNPALAKRNVVFQHPAGGGHKTTVEVQRKRMVVKPDSITGEYMLKLPPVRWKVQQVYCKGYPTLFQDGQVSEVIDLTNCLTPVDSTYNGTFTDTEGKSVYQPKESYNYRYSRIYHAPVEITYRQVGYDTFSYFGDKTYIAQTVGDDDSVEVPLAYQSADSVAYTFGYPVFSLERGYPIQLAVVERYPWNGVKGSPKEDVVRIGGGKVTIHNGMKNGLHQETVKLDSVGEGRFILKAEQTTRLLTHDDALRTVTMTLEQDGTTYEAKPLKGYVLNMFATSGAKDVLVSGQPLLIDILRDPPGGGSTATLSKGSKLKYTYTLDMKLHAGLKLNIVTGTKLENFQGAVAAGSVAGIINGSDNEELIDFEYAFDMEGKRAFTYTMNVNEDITTSSDKSMVGADADLYIGMVQNMIVTPVSTIRAIPDSMYQQMLGKLGGGQTASIETGYGMLVEIAEGTAQGKKYHLVRDESIGYGPQVTSQFVHSQKHILTQLIPEKVKELRALMFTGTAAEAQKLANATGKPVYRSLVDANSERFGLMNTKNDKIFYYTSTMDEEPDMNYVIHLPTGTTTRPTDEVAEKCQIIYAWVQMVAQNEHEKLAATEYVTNYDVDGGSKVTYSEQFESDYTISNYYHLPGVISAHYFDEGGADMGIAVSSIVGIKIVSYILKYIYKNYVNSTTSTNGAGSNGGSKNGFETTTYFYGSTFKFSLLPVLDYSVKDVSGEAKTYSRKESFTIAMDKKSHLDFDLYRVQTDTTSMNSTGVLDVFTNRNFYDGVDYVEDHLRRDNDMKNVRYARGFVYRTRGGATCNPWENERRTHFYEEGRILDERTKKIQNPKISLDRQSVSGVAIGDPARFKVYLTNDSEMPEAATGGLRQFNLYLDENSNPHGAKIYVDGTPLNSAGIVVMLDPGEVVQKTIEVYAGDEFDYEGLQLGLCSPTDWERSYDNVKFDVHYLRMAGPVNIASPGDKWVMNTYAQWNADRGWFMPITIDGFDKHQKNFDHIEFQYKESLRGEDSWTNLCSYYADSTLMAQANGVCAMIPENGNIVTEFYGEGTVMEKAYDLRAVLYCRDGNSFLTTPSRIVSGVKDTRRPQLFGLPEPKDGILTAATNIVFNFSEDIEYNYLNAITNFEVKGEVNNDNVSEKVSLLFTGEASVESEAQRNFSGKDVTIDLMVRPAETGRDMPLFAHGTNGQRLQLWLTKDFRLRAVVDEETFESDTAIVRGAFTQVALVIGQDSTITFYNGGKAIGHDKLSEPYHGTGPLIYGRTNETDRSKSHYYEGRMMEARLWYRALTGSQVGTTYGSRRLTGYEMGLVDYYPMNEGSGDYIIDHTQGANAKLIGASWAMPRGMSLHIDWDDRGLALDDNALNRTAEQDYTLMFWFKTDATGRGVLLANGAGSRTEVGAKDLFNIAFEAEKLRYRTHGMVVEVPGDWSDNRWHHYAMTVNRSRGVANIYVDQALRATFDADSLGAISGGHLLIGAARTDELNDEGKVVTIDTRNWLRGNIDELCLFEQALPPTLIQGYATRSPKGDEAGLLTYLAFDREERQKDNDIVLVPYPYSRKVHKDDKGEAEYELDPLTQQPTTTPVRDYPFVDAPDVILAHIDDATAAPVVPYEELHNLSFSFVGEGHRVLVDINEPSASINRRNIYVTVSNVEDKNGNSMASPATACYYVTNSALQWLTNRQTATVGYGQAEGLELTIVNNSAATHTYTIENCPRWLTLDSYSDIVTPKFMTTIRATVSKDLNVGTYDEIIYLTDEDGISEPFYLNLTVEAPQPDWAWSVPGNLLEHSMNIVARVYLNDEIDIDARDIIGVFDSDNVCHGFAHIDYSALTGESSLYLTVYNNKADGRELRFKLWQYATGRELMLTANGEKTIAFSSGTILGVDRPVRLEGGNLFVQTFCLKEGWNWVSFNVQSDKLAYLNDLLDGLPWQDGDILTDMNSSATLLYNNGHWIASGQVRSMRLSPRKAYAIKVQQDTEFPIGGSIISADDARTIEVKQGWNGIGYTPIINLRVETALSDYYDKALPGDVIKSHDEFAYFTVAGGTGRWRGNLQYMKPGEGYMLLRMDTTDVAFRYPFYEPGNTFVDEWAYATTSKAPARSRATMSLSAIIEGFATEEGDRLVAYADGERCGEAITAGDEAGEPLYLSIGGEKRQGIWFAIERNGDIVATTAELMTFEADAVVGSPDTPTAISFASADNAIGKWYTTGGVQLQKRPAQKGVYIYNGKKIVVK